LTTFERPLIELTDPLVFGLRRNDSDWRTGI